MDDGQHEGSVSVLAEVASTLAAYSFQHNEVDVWLSSPECRRFPALGKMSEMKEGKGLLNGYYSISHNGSCTALLALQALYKIK